MNLTEVTDLTSIGTLFAFVIVCAGVLVLQQKNTSETGKYKVPYINGKYLIPGIVITAILINAIFNQAYWKDFFIIGDKNTLLGMADRLPMYVFIILCVVLSWISFWKNLSAIPVLGLLCCMFLMTKLGYTNWLRFLIWLVVGLVIYFSFSRKNSRLNTFNTKTHGIQVR
jgi:amino acid transporter